MAKKRDIEGNRLFHFELSDKNRTVRWILIGLLLALGAVAVITGLISVLQTPAGWQTVEVSSTKMNCAHAFQFQYDLGAGEKSASVESKELSLYYGQLTEKAWGLFYNEAGQTEELGLYHLNTHPNEAVEVDEALYKALTIFQNAGNRALFLAPVYAAYDQVLLSGDVTIAQDRDPGQNEEAAQYIAQLIAFTGDPQTVSLELLPGNKVQLNVGKNYLKFAKENEIELFVDFGWLKNAAVVDYLADYLTRAGYTNGYLTSVDGFQRNLDSRGTAFSVEIFRTEEADRRLTATMGYTGPTAMAILQAYRIDPERYYRFENGRVVTTMIDPADGMCKSAANSLVSYSQKGGCLELSLKLMPLYVAETLSEDGLNALVSEGIYSVWVADKEVRYNQPDLSIQTQDANYPLAAMTY